MKTLPALLEHAEYLVTQDETELALKVLEMVPAVYRDKKIIEIENLKSLIHSKILNLMDLSADQRDMPKNPSHSLAFLNGTLRGRLLRDAVTEANKNHISPHLIDFGPGDYCFPIAMNTLGLQFTYSAITLNKTAEVAAAEILGSQYKPLDYTSSNSWFIAYEIIEHLSQPRDMLQFYHMITIPPKKIFLSTPKYCFGPGTVNWKTEGIHHLRAYTPSEFIIAVQTLFGSKNWTFHDDPVMCIVGNP